jgi:hypothetical protein
MAGTYDASQPSSAPTYALVMGVRQPPARKLTNLTAARAVRALEVLVFHPTAAPGVAAAMGIHERTARRLLHALEDEGARPRHRPAARRRLGEAAAAGARRAARRLPLVTRGEYAVHQLHESTGLDAWAPIVAEIDALALELSNHEREVVRRFVERAADAAERHADRLARKADANAHDALAVPLPALWA